MYRTISAGVAMVLLSICGTASAGKYAKIGDEVELYYEEAGAGAPLIFIPGWTATTAFFARQLPHFSDAYRVITYDRRGTGRSTRTPGEEHTHAQYGADLKSFMDRLGLKDVRLVVWSSGCLVGWAYVRAYGTENLKAFVCIDHSPKPLKTRDDDWGRELADFQTFYETMTSERRALLAEMAEGMLQGTASDDAVKLVVDENMKAPTYVAVELFTDRMFSDYSAEARMLDGTLPTMFFLSEEGSEAAMAWIEENAPNAEVVRLGAHMMFWEYPDEFNAALDAFLDRVR